MPNLKGFVFSLLKVKNVNSKTCFKLLYWRRIVCHLYLIWYYDRVVRDVKINFAEQIDDFQMV